MSWGPGRPGPLALLFTPRSVKWCGPQRGEGLKKKSPCLPLGGRRLTLAPAKEGTWFRRARRLRAPPPSAPSCRELLAGIRSPSLSISLLFPETFGNHS